MTEHFATRLFFYTHELAASGKSASLSPVSAARNLKEHSPMSARLPNYLKTFRKRTGISQDDLALLLGAKSGAKVSRYERCSRRPALETALAYEVIFRVPVKHLFAGLYQKVEKRVTKRVQRLARRLARTASDQTTLRKLAFLHALLSEPPDAENARP
jgi:transcriptional regulator with XRE-family HTH domain